MEVINGSRAEGEQIIIFEMVKKVEFGRALFLSGSLELLGQWDPTRALRLSWLEGDKWQGRLALPTALIQRIYSFEFKFLVSAWDIREGRPIEW
jgi:hypothetical protein